MPAAPAPATQSWAELCEGFDTWADLAATFDGWAEFAQPPNPPKTEGLDDAR